MPLEWSKEPNRHTGEGLEEIEISYCACTPAPIYLMKCGLFACSPVAPTLAVDLCVLEFMRTLFIWLTPNTTAWCDALESFLDAQEYQLQSQFSNAYHWYTVLTTYTEDHINGLIHSTQASMQQETRVQPSDYLCTCCPLCFGRGVPQKANTDEDDLNCIVCLDACFTQKWTNNPHNSATHDPPNPTNTVFIPESEVKAMEMFIDKHVEDGMKVPVSALDGCGESFHAADERWKKASTSFFADTGLMALLCCHDHVLWLQHYALVLLKYLFDHLLTTTTVGLLYDIGCQLEHSCHKWKLLDKGILSRLKFGISVFHAYGHQWPCQIVYHPCKCVGFGLSDGEGCEWLWSSLKMLIPILQVSGYHQRLFVLDNQIHHFDKKAFAALGQWLNKKWTLCKSKKMLALELWQAKSNGAKLCSHIPSLEKSVQDYQRHVDQLEMDLVNDHQLRLSTRKKSALGVSAQTDLYLLRNNKWLQTQNNAQALKVQIRECLWQCKFELECIAGSSRHSANDHHLQSHVESSINRREPAISHLITTYNTLSPSGAIPPLPIPTKGIFQLDVDSDIWQDGGPGEGSSEIPHWLADADVHKGIRLMLEVDHCNEEERRLSRE
ncbi:hypothetical protein EDC04DRAFT_2867975 [Pisolithus marmoratus]|nr:hypothetical protein EDC04DRAFT_2867975 [Pisolithus marmoratus]